MYFGNREFFPSELITDARKDIVTACKENGYDYIIMDESLTRYGAVETIEEGEQYAAFLKANEGKYDGVIVYICFNYHREDALIYADVPGSFYLCINPK